MRNMLADNALRSALAHGSVVGVQSALDQGASLVLLVDNPFLPGDQPIYPLMVAAMAYGNPQVIEYLLEAGADPTACASNSMGAQAAAKLTGHEACLALLAPAPAEEVRDDPFAAHAQAQNRRKASPPSPWDPPKPTPPWVDE